MINTCSLYLYTLLKASWREKTSSSGFFLTQPRLPRGRARCSLSRRAAPEHTPFHLNKPLIKHILHRKKHPYTQPKTQAPDQSPRRERRQSMLVRPARLCYKKATTMNNLLATYIHHIDPVIVNIPSTPLAVRWYGLAYVAGFILGYMVLVQLSRRHLYCVEEKKLGDFITAVCLFGVLMGGRLGEFFFYWLPQHGLSGLWSDPLWVLRVWEGGMASHGGILGVLIVAILWGRKNGWSLLGVCDGLAIVCTIGLFFGRVANFINGELYGRICSADNPLAMKFPQEMVEMPAEKVAAVRRAVEQAAGAPLESLRMTDAQGNITETSFDALMRLIRENDSVRETLGQFLNPRYPSQLFEALGEGLIIFIVLIWLRLTWKNAPAGIFSALFCFLYAAGRISTECFREPDAPLWGCITRGQYLSFAVVALGLVFLFFALRKRNSEQKPTI